MFCVLNVSQQSTADPTHESQTSRCTLQRPRLKTLLQHFTGINIMNTKLALALATVAIAILGATSGTGAFAAEFTEFKDAPGTASRASVKAELARAKAAGELTETAQTYGSFQAKAFISMRNRAEVRSEGVMAVHQHTLNPLYVGA
jgi:hypothetical protein